MSAEPHDPFTPRSRHQAMRRSVLRALAAAATAAFAIHASGAALTFDIHVEHGRAAKGSELVRVHEGDAVTLHVISDQPMDLHLHGYDIEWRVGPGVAGTITFTARLTGRFPIHAHSGGAEAHGDSALVYVEVYPR
jgi:precorrin-4 methylase